MKVVYLNPTGILGGAELCLLDILATVGEALPDWSPRVILGDDGPLRAAVEALGVPCEVLPMPDRLARLGDSGLGTGREPIKLAMRAAVAAVATSGYLARLRRCLHTYAPDVVQTNGMKAHVLGAWAAPRGTPVVWHLHDYLSSRRVMGRLLRGAARRGVSGVAVSRSVADDAERTLGARARVVSVHNAVDLSRFCPDSHEAARLDLDASSGLPPASEGTVRLGLVATYARWKGHEVFLQAAARVPRDRLCRFYVVGGPLYRSAGSQFAAEELRSMAAKLGLGDRVGFIPHQAEPESVYRALDVVVHASTRPEPFGRVIVEGMACGRAVVVTKGGGASELFTEGISALGTEPGDVDGLAAVLTRLIDDPALRRSLGAGGRAEAAARFDRKRLAREWADIYGLSRVSGSQ
jgi:glycosyltransferase involved in cell wall biosynthesis